MMDIQTEKDSHIGALFPRVHVSETKVPGPRAPPRNKMALFEQFTIPPHRFVPPLEQEGSRKVNSQGGGRDINSALLKPKQVKLGELSDVSSRKAKREASRCSVAELCAYSKTSKSSAACDLGDKDCGLLPLRNLSPLTHSTVMQKLWNHSTEESGIADYANPPSTDMKTRHSTVESRPISSSTERMVMPPCGWAGIGARDTDNLHALCGASAKNHPYNSPGATYGNGIATSEMLARSAASSGRFLGMSLLNGAHISQGFLQVEKITDEGFRGCIGTNDTGSLVQQMVCSDRSSEVAGVTGQDKPIILLEKCDVGRWHSDSLPRIIPKQVIEVIGQREFWEARTTMLQQQKILSTQVFELHRLIEVQRLIAAVPCHLLEGKDKCFVAKSSAEHEVAELSNKLVIRQSLNKDAKQCAKLKQAGVKGPKKPMKLSSGVSNTAANGKCQNPPLQVLPLKPIQVSLDHGRVSTWGIRPTWLNAESQNYGLCRGGSMAFGLPTSGHLYNEQQVLQDGSFAFTNWSRLCNVLPKFSPEVYNPPVACQTFVNGSLIHQLDCALGAQTSMSLPTPNQVTPVLRKLLYSTLSPSSRAQCSTPNINPQQETHGQERRQSSGSQKPASRSKKSTGDLDASHRAVSTSAAFLHEFRSERSGLGFQTFGTPISNSRGNGNETFAMVEDTIAVTESYVAHRNNPLFQVSLDNVSSVQKGEKNGVTTSKVIRAVPHPASEAVQAAAKILKSIQQSDSIQEGGYG